MASLEHIDAALAELGSEPADLMRLVKSCGGAGLSLDEADAELLSLASGPGVEVGGSAPAAKDILPEEHTTPSLMPPPPLIGMVESLPPSAVSWAGTEQPNPTLLEYAPVGQAGNAGQDNKATLLGVIPVVERLAARAERGRRSTLKEVRSSSPPPPPGQPVDGTHVAPPRTPMPASPSGGDLGEMVRASQPPRPDELSSITEERTAALSLDELRMMAAGVDRSAEERTAALSLDDLRAMANAPAAEDGQPDRVAAPSVPPPLPPPTPAPSMLAEASGEVEDDEDFELLVDEELLEIDDDDLEIMD